MEVNPFYQSDDEDISNGKGENNKKNGNKSLSRPQCYTTAKNDDKLKIIKVAKEIGNYKAAKMFSVSRKNV